VFIREKKKLAYVVFNWGYLSQPFRIWAVYLRCLYISD